MKRKYLPFSPSHILTLLLASSCLIIFSGCNLTSSERIAAMQSMVVQAQAQSKQLDQDLEILKTAVADMRTQLDRPDLKPEDKTKIEAMISSALTQTESVITKKQEIDAAIANWKEKIDAAVAHGTNVGNEISLWGEGLQEASSALPGSVGVGVGILGSLLGVVGAGISRRYKSQLNAEKANAVSIVSSVDKLLESTADVDKAKTILMKNQSGDAINRVRAIKAEKT